MDDNVEPSCCSSAVPIGVGAKPFEFNALLVKLQSSVVLIEGVANHETNTKVNQEKILQQNDNQAYSKSVVMSGKR